MPLNSYKAAVRRSYVTSNNIYKGAPPGASTTYYKNKKNTNAISVGDYKNLPKGTRVYNKAGKVYEKINSNNLPKPIEITTKLKSFGISKLKSFGKQKSDKNGIEVNGVLYHKLSQTAGKKSTKKAKRCTAKTKEGKRCKHSTKQGSKCGHHK